MGSQAANCHRVNLEEIGRLAGVPRSTVSRVVNGDRWVSAVVRRRS
jgi:DNA-binding LacI/PurR family transcriptional regulator